MTREERENALHCLKVMINEEVCEECNLYGTTGTDHCEADCVRTAIEALEQQEPIIDVSGVLHKIAEFFSNWDGDENSKMEISVKDMREISNMFVTKCRAESKLKVLEQEPCEDAISRAEAIRVASGYCHPSNIAKELAKLPPITPKQKVGHWIEGQTDNPNIHNILCSCCREGYPSKGHANSQYTREKFKYCPNCSARMVEKGETNNDVQC